MQGMKGITSSPEITTEASIGAPRSPAAVKVIPSREGPTVGPRVLVTVGTTAFDALIVAASSQPFLDCLRSIGCISLTLQIGRGIVLPFAISEDNTDLKGDGVYVQISGICSVRVVRYIRCLSRCLSSYDLVVSHCGAGSLVESLRAGLKVVACVNPDLLNNHQAELASQLAADGHCVALESLGELPAKTLEAWIRPFGPLPSAAASGSLEVSTHFVPLPPPNSKQFLRIIQEEIGVYPGLEAPTVQTQASDLKD